MKLNEFKTVPSAKELNESMAKRFGQRLNLDNFTKEQLENARNILRTKISQFEVGSGYDAVFEDETYQRSKAMLDVLNRAIEERDIVEVAPPTDKHERMVKHIKKGYGGDGKLTKKEKGIAYATAWKDYKKENKEMRESRYILENDSSDRGTVARALKTAMEQICEDSAQTQTEVRVYEGSMMTNPMREAYKTVFQEIISEGDYVVEFDDLEEGRYHGTAAALVHESGIRMVCKEGKEVQVSDFGHHQVREAARMFKECGFSSSTMLEGLIKEGEEEKAGLIIAAKDMVDRITGWMEDTANMQAEQMLELVDSIRDEIGSDVATRFEQTVKPALEAIYQAMESSRTTLNQGVGMLTGEQVDTLGVGPTDIPGGAPAMEPTAELPAPEMDDEQGDEFAASEPATGGEEAAGRAKRESIDFSRRLAVILTSKKN